VVVDAMSRLEVLVEEVAAAATTIVPVDPVVTAMIAMEMPLMEVMCQLLVQKFLQVGEVKTVQVTVLLGIVVVTGENEDLVLDLDRVL